MRILLLLLCCTLQSAAFAQIGASGIRADFNYDWETSPNVDSLKKNISKTDATILKDHRIIEYTINAEKGRYELYYTKHFLVHINSDKAIEAYNTIALPQHDVERVVSIKARTINPKGKIKNLDRYADFKEVANYENNGPFLIFALQGLETGSYVEYLYTFERKFTQNGTEYFRSKYPVREAEVEFYAPKTAFRFTFLKCNAEFVDIGEDRSPAGKNSYHFGTDLPGRTEEQYAANDAAIPRIEFRVNKEGSGEFSERTYWKNIGEGLWSYLTVLPKSEYKASKKLYKKVVPASVTSPEEKVRAIENYLKKNIQLEPNPQSDAFEKPSGIISKKTASASGLVRMYLFLSRYAGVKCQVVTTLSRFEKTFDPDFATYGFLREYVIYFPELDLYLSPTDYTLRLGYIPEELTCQKGLFIGTMTSEGPVFDYDLKSLVCHSWDKNLNNIDATAQFDLDGGMVNVAYQHTYTGFEAAGMQGYKLIISGEKDQQDFLTRVLQNYSGKNEPKNIVVTGNTEADLCKNPFVMKMNYSSEQLLEKAGPKYIFHVGELIGPQSELYRDTMPRLNWIENGHNRGYIRKLIVEIPDGYKITNPDAVIFNVTHGADNNEITQFKSSYKMEGNKMIIDIKETYGTIRYPKEDYEPFRKVINAAADFNKVVLYLEKQK